MPRDVSLPRKLATAARWPAGVALTSIRYLWRTTPLHRSEEAGTLADDTPPPLPDGVSHAEVQYPEEGCGPLFHRRYRTRIADTPFSPRELMDEVTADLDRVSPVEFASFQKVLGDEEEMKVGDEYVVRMAGPYDGPVRVIARTPQSFRLVTLDTHLEAGQIEFRARAADGDVVFEIESWARSRDALVNLLYNHLRMAKETQLHMWTSLLERTVKRAKGRMVDGIDIHTRKVEDFA